MKCGSGAESVMASKVQFHDQQQLLQYLAATPDLAHLAPNFTFSHLRGYHEPTEASLIQNLLLNGSRKDNDLLSNKC